MTIQNKKTADMTTGNPLRHILFFAIPLFIGNIFQQIYSVVDTMVAGYNLGDGAIAAIGATASLYGLIISFAVGLNSGYSIVVTREFGAHNTKKLKQSIAAMLMLNIAVAIVVTALSLAFITPFMRFLNTPDAIFNDAHTYIAIICGGILATVCYNMFAGIMRSVGNSRTPLIVLIISSFINMGLDVLFIMVFHLGIAGAALATVIAEGISAVMCGVYVYKNYKDILPEKEDFRVPKNLFIDMLSSGFAMALMLCVVSIGSVIMQSATNSLGEKMITAHTSARRIIEMLMQPLGTIATASSTFTSQNWGARKLDRIKSTIKQVMGLEIAWSVIACAIVFLTGGLLVRFTTGTSDTEIIDNAVLSMRLHLSFFWALGILLVLRTAMQAMGRKIAPVISSAIELLMKFVAAAWLIPKYGFFGVSITEPVTWVIMMVFLLAAYAVNYKQIFNTGTLISETM